MGNFLLYSAAMSYCTLAVASQLLMLMLRYHSLSCKSTHSIQSSVCRITLVQYFNCFITLSSWTISLLLWLLGLILGSYYSLRQNLTTSLESFFSDKVKSSPWQETCIAWQTSWYCNISDKYYLATFGHFSGNPLFHQKLF